MKSSIFASALLIAGAIITGFSLLADSELIFLGFGCMLASFPVLLWEPLAKYFATFYPKDEENKK